MVMPVVQIRRVRMGMAQTGMAVEMGVPSGKRPTFTGVIMPVMLFRMIVRMGVHMVDMSV